MRRLLFFGLLGIIFIVTTAFIITSGGIAGATGSPGEGNCSGCHSGGTGTTAIGLGFMPAIVANQFVPGQTYTINVMVSNPSFLRFGFGCEILTPANTNAGIMTAPFFGVKLLNSGLRTNAVQSAPFIGTSPGTFQFLWVAPTTGTANIYIAGNAVDGTGGTSGDRPSSSFSLSLTADLSAGVNEATLSGISGLNVYPNPIKSEFRISYNLIENSNVKVALYTIQGQEIAEISNENQTAGNHLLEAALPTDLAKGVYFVKLSVNGKQAAQRLIITQ